MDGELVKIDMAASFGEVVRIIEASKDSAFRKVNEELIKACLNS